VDKPQPEREVRAIETTQIGELNNLRLTTKDMTPPGSKT